MTGLLGSGHRELHPRKETAFTPIDDVPFRVDVRLGARHSDRIDPDLFAQPADVLARHARIVR
jgi:hypothetical protein